MDRYLVELFDSRGAVWGGIEKQSSIITPKEPVNNIEEEWKEYAIEGIIFASEDMFFKHLSQLG